MWEGQATSRRSQQLAAVALAVVSLPFALLGAVGAWASITRPQATLAVILTVGVAFFVGLFGLTIAYRLFFGRGVRRGGGVMSPMAFRIGGFAMLGFAAFLSYEALSSGSVESSIGVAVALFLSSIFFVAARYRGAMRSIK